MTAGLVLTGGGSLLCGIKDLAERIFKVPVRIGTLCTKYDVPESLRSPIYSTGYGLVMHTLKKYDPLGLQGADGSAAKRVLSRMKSWVSDFF
jgi:cell division protein FtsA